MAKQASIAFGILLFAVSVSHAQSPVPADTIITLHRLTDAFGVFPEYNLTIKSDGTVSFKRFAVPSLAKPRTSVSYEPIESKISIAMVAALVAEFERVKFFSLRDRYWKNEDGCPGGVWPDFSAAEISITLNGKSKTIFHYYGCLDENQRVYPAELDALATKIDTLVNTKQWLKIIVVDAEQIVGRERRERVSQLAWCGEGCFDSRRRVNSAVGHLSHDYREASFRASRHLRR